MSFCRITGKSRGLPRPNYFPVLPPISPADARRFCRITGKAYGLPKHHYIPVLIGFISRRRNVKHDASQSSSKTKAVKKLVDEKLKNGRSCREHELLPGYKYVFPVLDESTELYNLIDIVEGQQKFLNEVKPLSSNPVSDLEKNVEHRIVNGNKPDNIEKNVQNPDQHSLYVYPIDQKQYGLVLPEALEMAVRDGQVSDLLLAKNSDTLLLKLKKGRRISVGLQDFVNTNDSLLLEGEGPCDEVLDETIKARKRKKGLDYAKKIFEDKEKNADIEIEQEICEKRPKVVNKDRKKENKKPHIGELHFIEEVKSPVKSPVQYQTCVNFKSRSCLGLMGDWRDLQKPLIENFDWDDVEKSIMDKEHILNSNPENVEMLTDNVSSNTFVMPTALNIEPINNVVPSSPEFNTDLINACSGFEPTILLEDLVPMQIKPDKEITAKIKELNDSLKIDQPVNGEFKSEISNNNVKTKFADIENMLVSANDVNNAMQELKNGNVISYKNIHGLTLNIGGCKKFVPGQTFDQDFVPGTSIITPVGEQFIPGIVLSTGEGPELVSGRIVDCPEGPFFAAGLMSENDIGQETFIYGQTVKDGKGNNRFVEGQTVYSEEGPKFVAGLTANDGKFVPGQTLENKFVPGQTVRVNDVGDIFIAGQNVKINNEIKFIPGQTVSNENGRDIFVPGKSVFNPESNSYEFVAGQYVECSRGNCDNIETKFIPGINKENENGILEFLPGCKYGSKFIEGQIIDKKFVPGKTLSSNDAALSYSFQPVIKMKDLAIHSGLDLVVDAVDPVNISLTENPEKTFCNLKEKLCKNFGEEGTKFSADMVTDGQIAPGRIILTEQGWRFVPGQTVHTPEGPRFIPGHVIETGAGRTFIPGQIFYTEEKGNL